MGGLVILPPLSWGLPVMSGLLVFMLVVMFGPVLAVLFPSNIYRK